MAGRIRGEADGFDRIDLVIIDRFDFDEAVQVVGFCIKGGSLV